MAQVVCAHCGAVNRVPDQRLAEGPRCGSCHQPVLEGKPVDLTQETLPRQIERNELPVVVDFWAPWCGPCKMMAPAFAKTAEDLRFKARFGKVNTEEQQALAARYGIRSIPTLILFKQGREADRLSGALDAMRLKQWIEARL